jgi:tetratricopeptide (TPR) repeat protein
LGVARSNQAGSAYIPVDEGYRTARDAVRRALTLDPDLAGAHAALGLIQLFHEWDWAGADLSLRRALALAPGDAGIIRSAAALSRVTGRLDEAIELQRRALDIDPLRGHKNLGMALYYAGRHQEALAALNDAVKFLPEQNFAHAYLSRVELALSRNQEALAEAAKERHPVYRLCGLALAHHALGHTKESDAALSELIERFKPVAPYEIAGVYAFRGEKEQAFQWLERAYSARDDSLTEVKSDPLLKDLREDARFRLLLEKMRLPL